MSLRGLVVVVGSFLVVGCATVVLPTGQTEPPCVPSSLRPFAEWRSLRAEPSVVADEQGRPVLVIAVAYDVNRVPVRGVWIGRDLAVVDPDASDRERPVVVDIGLVDAKGRVRVNGRASCLWQEVVDEVST